MERKPRVKTKGQPGKQRARKGNLPAFPAPVRRVAGAKLPPANAREEAEKKKKNTAFLFLLAGVLVLAPCMYLAGTAYAGGELKPDPEEAARLAVQEQEIDMALARIDIIQMEAAPTPSPTPQPGQPGTAVDIVVNGTPVVSLSDEAAARALLTKYLNVMAVAPQGETFLYAGYEQEIKILTAQGEAPYYDFDTAFQLLFSEPDLIPVTVKTLKREAGTGSAGLNTEKNEHLYEGERRILQLGAGERTVTSTELTYVGDALFSTGEPVTEKVMAARGTLVQTGKFDSSGEKKDAGKKHKDTEIPFSYPMRGRVTAYYGVIDETFHRGLDIKADKGTKVTAPAEGVVIFCGERGDYGFVVDIDHGEGFVSRLTHLTEVDLELNQRVFAKDLIGKLKEAEEGETHLHYELLLDGIPTNPLFYLK